MKYSLDIEQNSRVKLSLIVLAYNEEEYIGDCLESIAAQTRPPDEVIVVNNNSTDKTAEIVQRFPFVKIINQPIQGMIPARNIGFNSAIGTLLGRIDADTRLLPDWVERVHQLLDSQANQVIALSGPCYFFEIKNKWFAEPIALIHQKTFFGISNLCLGHPTLFGSNMVLTRNAWLKVKDEICTDGQKVHEDIDLAIHIAKYGQILFAPKLEVGISIRPFFETTTKKIWRGKTWYRTIFSKHN